jgi:hypothetical protein
MPETNYIGKTGLMTARELMQYVGTNIFRKLYNDIWVEACLNKIQDEASEFAIITDCRFPNEVLAGKGVGAKVVRLTRNPNPMDSHDSEMALDKDKFDWDNFDLIIDNESMSIEEMCAELEDALVSWGWQ